MKRDSDRGLQFSPFMLDRQEIAQVNEFVDTEDAAAFLDWLQTFDHAKQWGIVTKILAYGCEYNELNVDIQSYNGALGRLLAHMTKTPFKISRSLGVDDEFVWNLLKEAEGEEFSDLATWVFGFYAANGNWRKFAMPKR